MQYSNHHAIRLITVFLLLMTFLAARLPLAAAQTEATQLSSLAVELWPDYDRPAMLVLLTGVLPDSATLPATVTIPVPAGADVNAVARFDETGALLSDVDYTVEDGRLTLTTPANRFRVEYYAPYSTDGDSHTYTFDWTSGLDIDQVTTVVQQPIAATDFRLSPTAAGAAAERGDGLNYHTLPSRSIGSGEPFTVEVGYDVDAPVLSAPAQALPTEETAPAPAPADSDGFSPLWLLAIAGALALVGGAWYLGHRQGQSASRGRKPQPARPAKPAASKPAAPPARYCHSCGRPALPEDTFCRHCGTQLKKN